MHSLFQCFLLLFTTFIAQIGVTNPNASSNTDYVPNEGAFMTSIFVHFLPKSSKVFLWANTFYQILYLFLQTFSSSSISIFFPQISPSIDLLPLTFTSILGYILIIIGGLGRLWCYKTLDKFFTFELTIRRDHKLIQTGPYACVRHPSYVFAYILMMGVILIHRRTSHFFPNQLWMKYLNGSTGIVACCMIVFWALRKRVEREELELAKAFGKEWIEYSSRRKRFLPGLI